MRRWRFFLLIALFSLFAGTRSFAKAPLISGLDDLVKISKVILIGQVRSVNADTAEVEVQRVIKGEFAGKTMSVKCDNNATGWVEDAVRYHPGERVLFCLEEYGNGVLRPFKFPGIIHIHDSDKVTIWDYPKPVVDENHGWGAGGDKPLYRQTILLDECIKRMEQYMREGEIDEKK